MKIRLKTNHPVLTATLIDNETKRDFVSLLPLTTYDERFVQAREVRPFARSQFRRREADAHYEVGEVVLTTSGNVAKRFGTPTPDDSPMTPRTSVRKSSRQLRQQTGALRSG